MISKADLTNMEDHDLVHEVLKLQKRLEDLKSDELHGSQIHNYHFAGNEIIKLNSDRYLGSGFILSITTLNGLPLVKPVTISDGFSNDTINCLLDELQRTFDHKTEFKPVSKRL